MADMNTITVMQVFRSRGIEPDPKVSWSVGSRVANLYAEEFGAQPPKDNRPKTNGAGSHCFAIYPYTWREKIESIIDAIQAADDAQGDLFEG